MLETINSHRKDLTIALLISLVALSLSLYNVGKEGINPDEYHWHQRTNEFHYEIQRGNWDKTMRAGHPGATITWQSMISLRTMRLIYRRFDPTFDYQDYPYLLDTFSRVHFAYILPIALTTSLFIGFAFLALKNLTNRTFALIASSLLITDVYFLAHSRVVQMDAIQAVYIISSVLTALLYQKFKRPSLVIATGVLLAFCWMTKIYGLAILPVLLLIIFFDEVKSFASTRRLGDVKPILIRSGFLFIPFIIVSVILLPPWILDFSGTIAAFKKAIFVEGLAGKFEGHEIFFGHKFLHGEPRIFYLFAFLFRQSIIPFLAFPLTLALLIKNKITDVRVRNLITTLGLIALYWTLILMIPNKKEDRYILADHVLIDIVSAGGIYALYMLMKGKRFLKTALRTKILGLAGGIVVTAVFIGATYNLNYEYLGYYNPLLGGAKSAVKFIRVGWGEGLRPIAEYINTLEDPENIRVASWYESSVAPFCECEVRPAYTYAGDDIDYVIFYVNQIQRTKETILIEKYFKKDKVVFTSYINNFPFAWLVEK